MSVQIVRTLPEKEWRSFVNQHPLGNIFHTPEMFQVFQCIKGYQPELWAATNNGKISALLLPVQITLGNALLRPFTTRAVVYGSVLLDQGMEGKQALAQLLRSYMHEVSGSPLFTELRNMSDLSDIQPILIEGHFKFEDHLNYLIYLNQPEEVIWHNFSRTLRQNIQKAQNSGIVIEEIHEIAELEIVYRILKRVYTRIRVPLASRMLFRSAFDILYAKEMLKIFVARLGDLCIGVNIILLFKPVIFGWYCGSDHSFSSFYPEPMMNWHILRWGKAHGYRLFDFGGAGKPSDYYGSRPFKAKFGGTLVNFGRNVIIHAPDRLEVSQFGYSQFRKCLGMFDTISGLIRTRKE